MQNTIVVKRDGSIEQYDIAKIHKVAEWACKGLDVSQSELELTANLKVFNNIKTEDIHTALIVAAGELITKENPDYTYAAARLLLQRLYKEVTGGAIQYPTLRETIDRGIDCGRYDPRLALFDLEALDKIIDQERDFKFDYLGLQTLEDRYLVREGVDGRLIELPQHFWMRVAMGLAVRELDVRGSVVAKEDLVTDDIISFYQVLSKFEFVSSTPTLFNAGTPHSQLSSCYLNTVADTISAEAGENKHASIMGTMEECANLSKYAGGIGTDWTRVRPAGAVIKGTNGKSSGIVPYLKIFNDTAVAVNQGGKRNGAFAAYLEPWHPDLYDFCDLKKNSGDERRRAHDIFPATWIPDLLMKRVKENGVWSFFDSHAHPELHELHGWLFERRYTILEEEGKFVSQKPAVEVWKKIVGSLFETGHPWITFKDEANRRNPQDHVGVIHGSNLCTEITLNTSDDETAVCNLGSVNLAEIGNDLRKLERVIKVAMKMLDNVIDINFYPSERARNSNMRHRPVGLGMMGYTLAMAKLGIDWESEEHLAWADEITEAYSYYAIDASIELARKRGTYGSYKGSKWDRGILPIDTAKLSMHTAGDVNMDWDALRAKMKLWGMRNSNCMAIAPTATISNIANTTPCIEPVYEKTYTKSNLSGVFLMVDPCLRYESDTYKVKEAFEIDQMWVIKAAAVRQKWIDQAQSINIFARQGIRGSELSEIYFAAWELGLKTTYYLRSKSSKVKTIEPVLNVVAQVTEEEPENNLCSIDNPDCESCQ